MERHVRACAGERVTIRQLTEDGYTEISGVLEHYPGDDCEYGVHIQDACKSFTAEAVLEIEVEKVEEGNYSKIYIQ